MLNRKLHILFILIILPLILSGQHIEMKHYTTSDGLPSNEVFHVMQDSTGYIWFCTDNGVSRFDGYEFENFDSSDGLAGSAILFSYQDYKGRIWFVSLSAELSYYQNDSIHKFKWNNKLQKKFYTDPVPLKRGIHIDSTDCVYLSFRPSGVYKIFPDGRIINWSTLSPRRNLIFDIPNGKTFIGKIYLGIDSISFIKEKKYRYSAKIPYIPQKKALTQITKLQKGHYIFSTGFDVFELKNEKLKYIDGTKNKLISEFTQDKEGRFWIGYRNHGIECYASRKLDKPEKEYLSGKSISTFLIDKQKGCWFTTLKNGVFYKPRQNILSISNTSIITSPRINYARVDRNNDIILGTADNYLNIVQNAFSNDAISSNPLKMIDSYPDENTAILLGPKYQYFGTERSLFSSKNNNYSNLHRLKTIRNNRTTNLIRAKNLSKTGKKSISIGTAVKYYHVNNAIPDKNNLIDTKEFAKKRVSSLEYDSSNNCVWIGSIDGLYQHNLKSDSIIRFSDKNKALSYRITSLQKISNQLLAIGTKSAGIIIYNFVNDTDRIFNLNDGLSSNSITSLTKYSDRLFAGTIKGINVLNINSLNKPIFQLRKSDGLISDDINELHVHDSILLVSTSKGLSYFTIPSLKYNALPLKVHIKKIEAPHQSILSGSKKRFTVSYPQSSIRFKYTPLTYNHNEDLTYRYRISGISKEWTTTADNEIFFPFLPPGDYTFEIMAKNKSGLWSKNPTTIAFSVESPLWQKTWFILLISVIIFLIAGGIIFLVIRNRRIKTKAKQDITYYQQQALINQMNPHFMFNSLNSIHRYLLEKKSAHASKFLSKFARLMRLFLKNSQSQLIPISKELESIRLYLQLENLRMNDKLEYHIDIDDKIDADVICIPSMLIQPLVENSIIHGIRYLEDRKGYVGISISKTNGYLKITVEDNGVGRQKAAEIEQKNPQDSFGNSIVLKRIDLLNQLYNSTISIKYLDLYEENIGAGTKVVFENFPITQCNAEDTDS